MACASVVVKPTLHDGAEIAVVLVIQRSEVADCHHVLGQLGQVLLPRLDERVNAGLLLSHDRLLRTKVLL